MKMPQRYYLKDLRVKLRKTQKQIATRMGVEVFVYCNIENGKRGSLMNAKKLYALAKALEISLDELCKWEIEYLNLIEIIKGES
ncbi:MAG: helix-turn-helix transcriptional regulator [Bacilli bacterium]|nr:helix-turn-helix transcriptional regulator [Bacilli bacterium]